MTDEELQAAVAKADERAEKLLQMPPVVKVSHSASQTILSAQHGISSYSILLPQRKVDLDTVECTVLIQKLSALHLQTYQKFLSHRRIFCEYSFSKIILFLLVLQIQAHIDEVLSKDPALIGYDTSTYLFTDITFGVHNQRRFIVER